MQDQPMWQKHWPEYFMEAAELGIFMLAACSAAVVLFDTASPIARALDYPILQRFIMGLAMGGTAVAIVYSPWGKRSGAHFNPAVTLTYLQLKKISSWDAACYMVFQFIGGILGVLLAWLIWGKSLASPEVNFIVTIPGPDSIAIAFLGEFLISFVLMSAVLFSSNSKQLNRFTGWIVGLLLAIYVTIEAPISGMSMNPARTAGSAVVANIWTGWWIYFTAPPLAMLSAAQCYLWIRGHGQVLCAKLYHSASHPCIFLNCAHHQLTVASRKSQ